MFFKNKSLRIFANFYASFSGFAHAVIFRDIAFNILPVDTGTSRHDINQGWFYVCTQPVRDGVTL